MKARHLRPRNLKRQSALIAPWRWLLGASLLAVQGRWESVEGVVHLIAQDMQDLSPMLGALRTQSRDFH